MPDFDDNFYVHMMENGQWSKMIWNIDIFYVEFVIIGSDGLLAF